MIDNIVWDVKRPVEIAVFSDVLIKSSSIIILYSIMLRMNLA